MLNIKISFHSLLRIYELNVYLHNEGILTSTGNTKGGVEQHRGRDRGKDID